MTVQQFDFSVNVLQSLIWQYNDATSLQTLIEKKQEWIDENWRDFWDNWYRDVFDLRTANDFGLSVWSKILGVQFTLSEDIPTVVFSFDGGGQTFDNAGFLSGGALVLTKEQKRTILQLRYRQMTSKATVDDVYYAVSQILSGGGVLDNLDMSMTLTMSDYPDGYSLFILDNYEHVIPRPAGVKFNRRFGYSNWFGFEGSGGQSFDNSSFGA